MSSSRDESPEALAATQPPSEADAPTTGGERRVRAVHSGDVLGRYALEDELGEGGMATVYRARDRELRREVAVKVLFPHLAKRAEVVQRFQREARAAAGLEHRNILRVYDVGGGAPGDSGAEPPYIVMELVRGRSLLAEIEARGAMLAEIAASVGALLADALAAAHAAGIIHRDVKPANAMIADGGRILLADFGVARLDDGEDSLVTKTGTVLGTPAYMSPEQAAGETVTRASDVYSLGAALYQLATGSLPYSGPPAKILAAIAAGTRTPAVRRKPAVGSELSRLIDRLMAIAAAARPSAVDAARELRAIASDGGLGEPPDELAAYFADTEAYTKAKLPVVIAAIDRRARAAIADRQPARAMALADRASALAPDDPIATALVAAVTSRDAAAQTKRRVVVVGAALVAAAGIAFGGVHVLAGSAGAGAVGKDAASAIDSATSAPAIAVAAAADAAPAAIEADAVTPAPTPPTVDAALTADARSAVPARARDAAAPARTVDAAAEPAIAAAPIDAAAAPPDAPAPVPTPLAPALAELTLRADTWCDVSIDDHARGRLTAAPIAIEPGHHHIVCAQPALGHTWSEDVDLTPGEHRALSAHVLPSLTVTIGDVHGAITVDGAPAAAGATLHLAHGPHRFGEAGGDQRYLTIAADCTLRDKADDRGQLVLDCF